MTYEDGAKDEVEQPKPLAIEKNIIMFGGIPVGQFDDGALSVNLGWCRLAGLSVRVEDDPQHDNHRGGVALSRDYGNRA